MYSFSIDLYPRNRVGHAQIASSIEQVVHPGIQKSLEDGHRVTIKVIGYDLPNLIKPAYEGWRNLLSQWLFSGVKVEYIALENKDRVEEILQENAALLSGIADSNNLGVVEIFSPKDSNALSAREFLLLEMLRVEYKTNHFMLAIDNNHEIKSQMWIEGNHQPGETFAEECYFYGSDEAFYKPEFVQKHINFEFLKFVSERVLIVGQGKLRSICCGQNSSL